MPAATAELLNGELGGCRISPTLALLTTRERQVAVAFACGMSNTQAAAALSMAAKTVEYHLGCVYRKLQIGSRRQLPAIAGQLTAAFD